MKINEIIQFLERFLNEKGSALDPAESLFLIHIVDDLKANDPGSAITRINDVIKSGQSLGKILDGQTLKKLLAKVEKLEVIAIEIIPPARNEFFIGGDITLKARLVLPQRMLKEIYFYGWHDAAAHRNFEGGPIRKLEVENTFKVRDLGVGEHLMRAVILSVYPDEAEDKQHVWSKHVKITVHQLTNENFARLSIQCYRTLLNSPDAQTSLRPVYFRVSRKTWDKPEFAPIIWFFEEVRDNATPFVAFTQDNQGFLFPNHRIYFTSPMDKLFLKLTKTNYATVKPNINPLPIGKMEDGLWEISKEKSFASEIRILKINKLSPSKTSNDQNIVELRQDNQPIEIEGEFIGNGNIKLRGNLIDLDDKGKPLKGVDMEPRNVSTTAKFAFIIPEVLVPSRYVFSMRAEPPYDREWIISDGCFITIIPSRVSFGQSSIIQELTTNPKFVHALHIRTPGPDGTPGFYNLPIYGIIKPPNQFDAEMLKQGILRIGTKTLSWPSSTKMWTEEERRDSNNFFKVRIQGSRLSDVYYMVQMEYFDNTQNDRNPDGMPALYTILIPDEDAPQILPLLEQAPEILIEVFRKVYPGYDYSENSEKIRLYHQPPRTLMIDKSHVRF